MLNTQENKKITDLNFVTAILAVRLSRTRLVVVLEARLHIYDMASITLLHTAESGPNPLGLAALGGELLAYPGPADGSVTVFDLAALAPRYTIAAHTGPLAALAFSPDGQLATASSKGTIVRVWRGSELRETFRRGSYQARIYCLAWDPTSSLLAVSSDSGTVHLFRLGTGEAMLSKYLPAQVSSFLGPMKLGNTLEQTRSESLVRLPTTLPTVCALDAQHVYVAAADGYLYTYRLAGAVDGVLNLQHQNELV